MVRQPPFQNIYFFGKSENPFCTVHAQFIPFEARKYGYPSHSAGQSLIINDACLWRPKSDATSGSFVSIMGRRMTVVNFYCKMDFYRLGNSHFSRRQEQ